MYAELAWVLVSSGTQVQPQVILDPDYLSVSYDYVEINTKTLNMSCKSAWAVLRHPVLNLSVKLF